MRGVPGRSPLRHRCGHCSIRNQLAQQIGEIVPMIHERSSAAYCRASPPIHRIIVGATKTVTHLSPSTRNRFGATRTPIQLHVETIDLVLVILGFSLSFARR